VVEGSELYLFRPFGIEIELKLKEDKEMKKRISRRDFLRLSAALATGAVAAACAPATPQVVEVEKEVPVEKVKVQTVVVEKEVPAKPKAPVLLSAHFTYSPTYQPRITEHTIRFEEAYPGIKVKLIFEPWDEWQTKVLTMAAAGTMPDLVAVHMSRAQVLACQGALLPVDDWVAADPEFDVEDFYPASLVMHTWKGKLYGFPWDWGCGILGYNKDMFDEAGIDYPDESWTMDDLLAVSKQLTKPGDTWGFDRLPGGYNESGPSHLGPWGGAFLNDDETKCLVDTPESIEALHFWADFLLKHKAAPTPSELEALQALGARPFHTGKIGMTLTYPWDAGETAKFAKFDWDVAPWPMGPVKRSSGAGGSGYAIGRDTKHPEEAWLYLRWFSSKEGQEYLWGKEATSIPSRQSVYKSFVEAPTSPEHAMYWIDALRDYSVLARPISPVAREFLAIIRREFELIFLGEKPVEEAAKAICKEGDEVLAENKKWL